MNKSDRRQVNRALSVLHSDARYAAATLAAIQRSANARTADEVSQVIESYPGVRALLDFNAINRCYVPKEI